MSGIQFTVPLQLMCRLMVAGQVGENLTLPSVHNSSLAETNNSLVLPSGYVAFPEIGFAYKLYDELLTHNEARKKCLNENAQVAVIDSKEKIEKIFNHFGSDYLLAAGLVRVYGETEWTTVDGKSTNDLPWADRYPVKDHNCVFVSMNSRALKSENCDGKNRCVCEIALPRKLIRDTN